MTQDSYYKALQTYSTLHGKAGTLLRWINMVLEKTINKDLEEIVPQCHTKVLELRRERLRWGKGRERKGREGKKREGKGKEGNGREEKGKEGKGMEREGKEREGKSADAQTRMRKCWLAMFYLAAVNFETCVFLIP